MNENCNHMKQKLILHAYISSIYNVGGIINNNEINS